MRCESCGFEALALKTVRWRTGKRRFALCDPCCEPLRDAVWIVPGLVPCFGTCSRCNEWVSVRDLRGLVPGGRRSAWAGTCVSCAG